MLGGVLLLAAGLAPLPAFAQEHPARRVATIVSVAVEEYGKAVDARGKLISAQEYQETTDFLADASRAAERLSGTSAGAARAMLDSISKAVATKRPPAAVDSLESRCSEAKRSSSFPPARSTSPPDARSSSGAARAVMARVALVTGRLAPG